MSRGVGIVVGVGISSFFPLTSYFFHRRILPSSLFHHPSYIEEFFHQPSAIIKDPCS